MTDDAIAILKKRYNISDESIAKVIQEEKDMKDPERIAQVFEDIAKLDAIMDRMEREIDRLRAALIKMDCDCALEKSPPEDPHIHDELCNYRIAREAL